MLAEKFFTLRLLTRVTVSKSAADIATELCEFDSGERMTDDQAEHLRILCKEAGVPFETALTRAFWPSRKYDLLARVSGKFEGTPTGICVEDAVRTAWFPRTLDGFTTPHRFELK